MSRWDAVRATLRELFSPAKPDDEDDLDADTAARTRWVQEHRHPPEGGDWT